VRVRKLPAVGGTDRQRPRRLPGLQASLLGEAPGSSTRSWR